MHITKAYILARNEEKNIGKCLQRLSFCSIPVILLDSGSNDETLKIAREFPFCTIEHYNYITHPAAYNEITCFRTCPDEYVIVLDADMEISSDLFCEVSEICRMGGVEVIKAPVQMFVDGIPLKFGSLYPPKPFVFRGGKDYFVPAGHGERLRPGVRTVVTRFKLIHNDLKDYSAYLVAQYRYGQNLWGNYLRGAVSMKDRIRLFSVWGSVLMMLYSYIFRGGIFAGKVGWIYALDRLIAGLIQYRIALANRLKANSEPLSISARSPRCTRDG